MTSGIVLAGGRSTRFGRDKLAVTLADGRTLLAHAIEPLARVCDRVALVTTTGGEISDLPASVLLVPDPEPFGGPVVGVLAGLAALACPAAEVVLIAAGDMPSMRDGVLRLLADALTVEPSVECVRLAADHPGAAGRGGPWAVMPCAVRAGPAEAAARKALADGDRSLRGFLDRLSTTVVPARTWLALDPAAATTRDIDYPDDLKGG